MHASINELSKVVGTYINKKKIVGGNSTSLYSTNCYNVYIKSYNFWTS